MSTRFTRREGPLRFTFALALASANVTGCTTTIGLPLFADTRPPAPRSKPAVDPQSVRLRAPTIHAGDLVRLVKGPGRADEPQDFRVWVRPTPEPVFRADLSETLGALRSTDRVLDLPAYRAMRCSWALHAPARPFQIVITPDDVEAPACPDMPIEEAKLVASPIVDDLLDEMRVRAAMIGADLVNDLRCFASTDLLRVWCEATAVRTPDARAAIPAAPTRPAPAVNATRATSATHTLSAVNVTGEGSTTEQTLAALAINPAAPRAGGPVRVSLRVEGGELTQTCPTAAVLRARVAGRLGRDPFDDAATTAAEVAYDRAREGWRARVRFTRAGRTLSSRTLHVRGDDCAPLAASLTLTLMLALGG